MSSPYAQALELLARVQEQLRDIKPDALKHRLSVQTWYALSQNWKALGEALVAVGEVADNAVAASEKQRERFFNHWNHDDAALDAEYVRGKLAKASLDHFRYVTALSKHAQTVKQNHELELANLQAQYERGLALEPHAHLAPAHRNLLDGLERRIEARKRNQPLEVIYIRWLQQNAAANLTKQSQNFHLQCKIVDMRKAAAGRARKRADHLVNEECQRTKDYEHIDREVLFVEMEIDDLWNASRSGLRDTAVTASTRDEKS